MSADAPLDRERRAADRGLGQALQKAVTLDRVERGDGRRMIARVLLAFALLVAPASAERLEWHSAPAENLEHVDVAQFATARQTIDIAAYVLTDWAIMDALRAAARRGVGVRIVLDGSQFGLGRESDARRALFAEPNVLVRVRPSRPDIMHLKTYAIDGRLLRTGSANFSASGLKRQANDLLITDDRRLVDAFTRVFETLWDESEAADPRRSP